MRFIEWSPDDPHADYRPCGQHSNSHAYQDFFTGK
jgi:hypothetical protein